MYWTVHSDCGCWHSHVPGKTTDTVALPNLKLFSVIVLLDYPNEPSFIPPSSLSPKSPLLIPLI